jgi:transposase InsO family protein
VDKEALAIIYAVHHKFQQYITGRKFILKTGHKPLERLFGSTSASPTLAASRLSRWAMTLSNYKYEIQYHASGFNAPADVLSRFPVDPAGGSELEKMGKHSNVLHLKLQDITISKRQIQQKTVCDSILSQVIAHIERGWPGNSASLPKELHTFFEKRSELSVEENILLWRGRIVVPNSLQPTILQLLHEGHPGVCSMRELAKFYTWWPRIDDDIDHHVASCIACQQGRQKEPEVPLFSWSVPSEPWARIHIDFAGPFENYMWLIIIDAYTKWIEVIKMKTTTTAVTCAKLREVFARLGVPRVLVSDNGPQLTSDEFEEFCKTNLIHHIRSTPWHAKTNGLAERAVRTFKERMAAAKESTADINVRLQKFLISYRNSPQKSTGRPPAEMMFGRRLRTQLDLLKPDVRAKMEAANFRQQRDHDTSAQSRSFAEGDPVWVMNTSGTGHQQGEVLRRTGPLSYLVLLNGLRVRKHADQLRFRRTAVTVNIGDVIDADADSNDKQIVLPEREMKSPTPNQPTEPSPGNTASTNVEPETSSTTSDSTASPGKPQPTAEVISETSATSKKEATEPLRRSQRVRRFPTTPYDKYV